jgi:hypothetical protein
LKRIVAIALALAGLQMPAQAQTPTLPSAGAPSPAATPTLPLGASGGAAAPGTSSAAAETTVLSLSAFFSGDPKPIRSGLTWRVYEDRGEQPTLLAKSDDSTPSFTLPAGAYIVHAAYGFAGATKRITVAPTGGAAERLTISAGALQLGGIVGDNPIPPAKLSFSIFVPVGNNSEGRLVRANVKAGDIVRLPEGVYHVVSTYGDSNAIMRADLRVEAGRVTAATLNHRAATVTLKLVASAGGEAFAGTAFTVLTPGGDVIREAIGAFPSLTLADGDYVVIARHEGQVYTREFKVESGLDRDIEVTATR